MKKISLVFAMVFAAGMVMAQNTSLVEQVGNLNGATVSQTGTLNDATAKQIGNSDVALVKQIGTSNIGVSDQINGNSNNSTVDQDGTSNEAYLTQGMVPNYYAAPYNISSSVPAFENVGSIKQIGSNNYSEFVQVGTKNSGSVSQNGNGNIGYAYQGWAFGFWGETPTTAALSSTNSTATISQIHNNNDGNIWQYGGDNNKANMTQDGNSNLARISQGFIYADAAYNFRYPVYNTKNNTATITQSGDGNAAKLFQLGDANSFTLTQSGGGNKVGIAAGGLLEARNGYFEQDGDGNTFVGAQANGATLDNTSRQTGNDNYINLSQGTGDVAKIIQDGSLNDAILTQGGGGQTATILQDGNSNIATVTQGL